MKIIIIIIKGLVTKLIVPPLILMFESKPYQTRKRSSLDYPMAPTLPSNQKKQIKDLKIKRTKWLYKSDVHPTN